MKKSKCQTLRRSADRENRFVLRLFITSIKKRSQGGRGQPTAAPLDEKGRHRVNSEGKTFCFCTKFQWYEAFIFVCSISLCKTSRRNVSTNCMVLPKIDAVQTDFLGLHCVYASGVLISSIFPSLKRITQVYLHFGQNNIL